MELLVVLQLHVLESADEGQLQLTVLVGAEVLVCSQFTREKQQLKH